MTFAPDPDPDPDRPVGPTTGPTTGPTAEPTAHWGTFDAERWWRPGDLATLPAVRVPGGGATVAALDELLAAFCAPGDLLVTRHPMAAEVRAGLADCGITFDHHTVAEAGTGAEHGAGAAVGDVPSPGDRLVVADGRASTPAGADVPTPADGDVPTSVDRLIVADPAAREAIGRRGRGAPYAVLPDTEELAGRLGWADRLPPAAVVAEVNSKTWSHALVRKLALPGAGRVVRSVEELAAAVAHYGYPAVVKDPYGVSGRDTLRVDTPGVLAAIQRTLRRQVEAGRRVELLVQRHHTRERDLSGHLEVSRSGDWRLLGVQEMTNRGFRHLGSRPAGPALLATLEAAGYPDVLGSVAGALADAGYWGPVGVDSMLLADGTLVPVLEVNARRSLGLLSLVLDRRARQHRLRCHLWQADLAVPGDRSTGAGRAERSAGSAPPGGAPEAAPRPGVAELCAALRRDGALYRGGPEPGVTVLSGSTLSAPGGRVYCALFCPPGGAGALVKRVRAAVAGAGMAVRGAADVG